MVRYTQSSSKLDNKLLTRAKQLLFGVHEIVAREYIFLKHDTSIQVYKLHILD